MPPAGKNRPRGLVNNRRTSLAEIVQNNENTPQYQGTRPLHGANALANLLVNRPGSPGRNSCERVAYTCPKCTTLQAHLKSLGQCARVRPTRQSHHVSWLQIPTSPSSLFSRAPMVSFCNACLEECSAIHFVVTRTRLSQKDRCRSRLVRMHATTWRHCNPTEQTAQSQPRFH